MFVLAHCTFDIRWSHKDVFTVQPSELNISSWHWCSELNISPCCGFWQVSFQMLCNQSPAPQERFFSVASSSMNTLTPVAQSLHNLTASWRHSTLTSVWNDGCPNNQTLTFVTNYLKVHGPGGHTRNTNEWQHSFFALAETRQGKVCYSWV